MFAQCAEVIKSFGGVLAISQETSSNEDVRWRVKLALIVLYLQAFGVLILCFWLGFELFTKPETSSGTGVALLALVIIGFVWIFITAKALAKYRSWSRPSTVSIEVMFMAVGVGSWQGEFAEPLWLIPLLLPAILVLWLIINKKLAKFFAVVNGDETEPEGYFEKGDSAGGPRKPKYKKKKPRRH